jgi:hypothetical protein
MGGFILLRKTLALKASTEENAEPAAGSTLTDTFRSRTSTNWFFLSVCSADDSRSTVSEGALLEDLALVGPRNSSGTFSTAMLSLSALAFQLDSTTTGRNYIRTIIWRSFAWANDTGLAITLAFDSAGGQHSDFAWLEMKVKIGMHAEDLKCRMMEGCVRLG